ncbi:alpha-mannosidase [Paenibacillus nasutitermitis]|uniref:Glycoside hydrolase n=1 Tax=Paenibacillus nasutitermitis TaxID=1652958 RepID=A0A917E1A3_9BACL|nr:glycoside hydrolase family 38 C-terminal domain-containing protein [Paenibacillus nasutitermitis]GGD88897.1 glycoside hydrolase [Paenibacillus nasutitermitis]
MKGLMDMGSLEKIHVVSHTHWDREWYRDFQGFRKRLVYLVDELLDVMERDPEYRYFTMDGHTVLIDDYLEIRPENKDRLFALIRCGRIVVGPWYVMPDEFLVSGESLIRNLLTGFRRSREYGAQPMRSGYVPDIFGHNSQLPQLLQGFGIDNAVLFRGFKGKDQAAELRWRGADGSSVLALRLDEDRSYGDFYFFIRWPFAPDGFRYDNERLARQAMEMKHYKSARATTTVGLGLDGVDHVEIEPDMARLLQTLNKADKVGLTFVHSTLEKYLDELRPLLGDLELREGEQRSPGQAGLNNMVLANVLSSRSPLKRDNWQNEQRLETWAEPWSVFAYLSAGKAYPKRFLAQSWEWLLQNHAHDSICGCSIRQVHKDMEYRFDQSRLLSEGVIEEQLRFISNHINVSSIRGERTVTVFNPMRFERRGVVLFDFFVPADNLSKLPGPSVGAGGFRIYDDSGEELSYQIVDVARNKTRSWRPYRDIPYADQADWYRVAVDTTIPSYGYRTFGVETVKSRTPGPGEYTGAALVAPIRHPGSLRTGELTWDNGRVGLTVHRNGSVTIEDHHTGASYAGLHLFESDGDVGEGWNRIAPELDAVYGSWSGEAVVSIQADGPHVAVIAVEIKLPVPVSAVPGETRRSADLITLAIRTTIELRKADPLVRFHTSIVNTARDHRVRLRFPTGRKADHYYTSTPFDLVRRERRSPDYRDYMETDAKVVPHNGIVAIHDDKAGLAIVSKGLYEAAMTEEDAATALLTLYRSTRKEVLTDGDDSGQLLQELTFDYAVMPYAPGPAVAESLLSGWQAYVQEIRYLDRDKDKVVREDPFRSTFVFPPSFSFLTLEASEGVQLTALKAAEDRGGSIVTRLFNATLTDQEITLRLCNRPLRAYRVNLDEQRIGELRLSEEGLRFAVGAKKLETIELVFAEEEGCG